MITLDHYGLHWMEGDIGLLVQDRQVDHVLGIQMKYDVVVKGIRRGLVCPHDINIHAAVCVPTPDDAVFNYFLPVPKAEGETAMFLDDTGDNKELVRFLLQLSSSGRSEILPLWMLEPSVIAARLNITNLTPLVLYGYQNQYIHRFRQLVELSYHSPRRLVFLGNSDTVLRPEIKRASTTLTAAKIAHLPLEAIGANALKEKMLKR